MDKRVRKFTSNSLGRSAPPVDMQPGDQVLNRWIVAIRPVAVILTFMLALAIRLYHINQPPLDFHAVRQYHSLIIARGLYYETLGPDSSPAIPEWKREIASLNRQQRGIWEPPIMEELTVVGYHLAGGEYLWTSRLLASLVWCLGGLFLYRIVQRITEAGSGAALYSVIFYLFFPFAVLASRSFQPDALMVTGLVASIYLMLRYLECPSTSWLSLTATVWAAAFLVKGISMFPILISFLVIGMYAPEYRCVVFQAKNILLFVLALLPTVLFYGYAVFFSKSLLGVASGNILPSLLTSPSFWKGWVEQIGNVVGYTAFVGALLGTLHFRPGLPRGLLLGLWCGYLIFGLIFSYTVHTHDYWNLQIIPVVALALGPLAALLVRDIRRVNPSWAWQVVILGILFFAALLLFVLARPKPLPATLVQKVEIAEEVGTLVGHSQRTIFLSSDYGLPLEYHGELSGVAWPIAADLEWGRLAGVQTVGAEELYRTKFASASPDFFIVLDHAELDAQPDLKDFLMHNFPLLASSSSYLIFDLRK